MTETRAAKARVKRGAKWLDENFPHWEKRIDRETLNLRDEWSCICGQVFSNDSDGDNSGYRYAVRHLFTEAKSYLPRAPDDDEYLEAHVAVELGFQRGGEPWVNFEALQKAWERLLQKRAKEAT